MNLIPAVDEPVRVAYTTCIFLRYAVSLLSKQGIVSFLVSNTGLFTEASIVFLSVMYCFIFSMINNGTLTLGYISAGNDKNMMVLQQPCHLQVSQKLVFISCET